LLINSTYQHSGYHITRSSASQEICCARRFTQKRTRHCKTIQPRGHRRTAQRIHGPHFKNQVFFHAPTTPITEFVSPAVVCSSARNAFPLSITHQSVTAEKCVSRPFHWLKPSLDRGGHPTRNYPKTRLDIILRIGYSTVISKRLFLHSSSLLSIWVDSTGLCGPHTIVVYLGRTLPSQTRQHGSATSLWRLF
jgi:hypothetical protein